MQSSYHAHPMNWTGDPSGYMGGVFSCDKCHKSQPCANGRLSCVPCKYDICSTCACVQCAKNHLLAFTTDSSGYMGGVFACDSCHKSQPCTAGRWSCPPCKYDVCTQCRPAPAGPQPVPMTAFIQCGEGDPLEWSKNSAGYMMDKFSCDICKKATNCGVGRWSCQKCKYDICHDCRPPTDEMCPKDHVLKASFDSAGYMGGKYACDKCHSSYPCDTGRYTCPCKYDVCPVCKSA